MIQRAHLTLVHSVEEIEEPERSYEDRVQDRIDTAKSESWRKEIDEIGIDEFLRRGGLIPR